MSKIWSIAEAKSRLSEILRLARSEGPQRIGKRDTVMVVSEAEWHRLQPPARHLGQWLIDNAPRAQETDEPFDIPRTPDRAPPRFDETDE